MFYRQASVIKQQLPGYVHVYVTKWRQNYIIWFSIKIKVQNVQKSKEHQKIVNGRLFLNVNGIDSLKSNFLWPCMIPDIFVLTDVYRSFSENVWCQGLRKTLIFALDALCLYLSYTCTVCLWLLYLYGIWNSYQKLFAT